MDLAVYFRGRAGLRVPKVTWKTKSAIYSLQFVPSLDFKRISNLLIL